jgi:V/A-type H+/Na+-transporting ATPase subunit I
MRWFDRLLPVRMTRVALVAPAESVRDLLVSLAGAGTVEIDVSHPPEQAADRESALSRLTPDLTELAASGRSDLIAGENQLRRYAAGAVGAHQAIALAGWLATNQVPALSTALAGAGCAVVPLRRPATADPPTLTGGSAGQRALTPLVSAYGTVPYRDVNPAWLTWGSYVLMFGMMFGDVGDGLLLIVAAIAMAARWTRLGRRYHSVWPFVGGAGLAATLFGFAYGEFFGPSGLLPVLWLDPIASPVRLLLAGLAVGVVLLAVAYLLGVINRWREGGLLAALYAPSGLAGAAVFVSVGAIAAGLHFHLEGMVIAALVVATVALILAFTGFVTSAGGGGSGVIQASVESFDLVVRLVSNIASFARLAAFGLAHAALGLLVWDGTRALWHRGGFPAVLAIVLLVVGSALAFALEGLVAAVQALRLEYYELFSRVFVTQGRAFRPWRLRIDDGIIAESGGSDHRAIGLKEA